MTLTTTPAYPYGPYGPYGYPPHPEALIGGPAETTGIGIGGPAGTTGPLLEPSAGADDWGGRCCERICALSIAESRRSNACKYPRIVAVLSSAAGTAGGGCTDGAGCVEENIDATEPGPKRGAFAALGCDPRDALDCNARDALRLDSGPASTVSTRLWRSRAARRQRR